MTIVSTHKELIFIPSRVCHRFSINWNKGWLNITQLEKYFHITGSFVSYVAQMFCLFCNKFIICTVDFREILIFL
jgi:hypothetical protein